MAAKKPAGKNWIAGAINPANKGQLHKDLKVPAGKPIPAAKLEKAEASPNKKVAARARLAETLKGMKKK